MLKTCFMPDFFPITSTIAVAIFTDEGAPRADCCGIVRCACTSTSTCTVPTVVVRSVYTSPTH